jgi:tripartite-type tricarboxylate transporter receptor subunit TctC
VYLVSSPNILVVHPSVPLKSVGDLIDFAKTKPGLLNYASSSIDSSAHLAGEMFKSMAGVNIVHIPYKGTGPAIINLIGDQVQMMFATAASVTAPVKSGKLKAVAVSSHATVHALSRPAHGRGHRSGL